MMEEANTANASAEVDPWQLAKDRYLEGLDSDERALFNEATIENLYYKASNEARDEQKRKTTSAIRKLQPLVAALKDYGEALDVYSNISPLPLAPLWGSIRVLLVFAEKYDKYYNRIVDVLGRIGDLLPRFKDYGRIFDLKKHPRLRLALSEIYFDIIKLCIKFREILQSQTRVSLKRFSKPLLLDVQYEDALEQFRRHKKTVEKEAEACHIIDEAESRALMLQHKELQELKEKAERRKALLSQLSAIDYSSRLKKLRAARHGNTGAWLKVEPEYISWLECDTISVLRCYGIPGCGKSVLASSIIDALIASSQPHVLTYYFCDYVDKRTLDSVTILGTITQQLLEKIEIPPTIEKLITENYGDERTPDWRGAVDVLVAVIRLFPAVTLILDGIDEVDEDNRKALFFALNRLGNHSKTTLKLLISCREDAIQSLKIPAMTSFRIHIQPSSLALDIKDYISCTIESLFESGYLVIQDLRLKEIIIDKLAEGAQGMFLWVKFQLDDLCDAESDAEIKRVLNNLPKDLSETYARLLKRITGSQRQELAKRIFQWIICARRPLHVNELREGIAFTINDQFFDREKLPTDMPRLIRGCGNLVVIDEDTEQVRLAHYTVQQYILLKEGISQDPCQPYCFTYDEANNAIGETCIAYLSFSDFERQISRAINKPLVEMAVFQRATATGTTTNLGSLGNKMRQVISLAHKPSTSCMASLKIDYQRLLPRHRPPSNILTRTYQLLNYVIDNWLSHIIAFKSTSMSKRDRMFEALVVEKDLPFTFRPWESSTVEGNIDNLCLLGWVLENDHVPTLQAISYSLRDRRWALELLLEACIAEKMFVYERRVQKERMLVLNALAQLRTIVGADRNEELSWLYSKLILACRNGNLQVLRYCFDSQAEWFRQTFAIGHMLCEAVAYGREEVVEWLVDASMWDNYHTWLFTCNYLIDEYDTHYFNPLEIAILRGYPRIATIIKGEVVEKVESHILFDILSSHMDDILKNDAVVDAILQTIDPQTTNEKEVLHLLHYNALSHAARSGDASHIARYERSFKLEKPVKDGLTPLSSAILERNTPLIRVLVNLGADTQAALVKLFIDVELNTQALFEVFEDNIEYIIRDTAFFDAVLEVLNPTMRLFLVLKEGDKSRINQLIQVLQIADPHGVPSQTLVSAISEGIADPARIVDLLNAETYGNQLEAAAWYAIRVNDLSCLRLLTKMGATLTTRDENALSTLEYVVQNKQQDIFFYLLQISGTGLEEIPCSEESFNLAGQWDLRPGDWESIMDYYKRSKRPLRFPGFSGRMTGFPDSMSPRLDA